MLWDSVPETLSLVKAVGNLMESDSATESGYTVPVPIVLAQGIVRRESFATMPNEGRAHWL